VAVEGEFTMGGNVSLTDQQGREVARGLTNFSSADLERIKGLKTDRIEQVLGTASYFEEVVHRDNLVVI
jgi:glutamate 5-kinase